MYLVEADTFVVSLRTYCMVHRMRIRFIIRALDLFTIIVDYQVPGTRYTVVNNMPGAVSVRTRRSSLVFV